MNKWKGQRHIDGEIQRSKSGSWCIDSAAFCTGYTQKKVARLSISTAKDEVNGIFTMLVLVVLCQGERKHDAKER